MNRSFSVSPAILGVCCALASTIIWSGNFIIARGLSEVMPPVTLAFLRWSTATLVVIPFGLRTAWEDRNAIRANFPFLMIVSLLGVTLFNTLVYIAGHSTAALNLSLISTSFPVFIILISRVVFGDPISWRRFAGVLLAISGVVGLVTRGNLEILTSLSFAVGDLWIMLAAIIFAVYSILVRRTPKEIRPTSLLMVTFSVGLTMLTPWMLWEQSHTPWPDITPVIGGCVLYIGVFASLAAYFCWNKAVSLLGPAKAGFIYYSIPVFSGLAAWLILGEPITIIHGLCGGLIVGGICLSSSS